MLIEMCWLLLIDFVFVVAFVAMMASIGIWNRPAYAVMKRNFMGYFSSPTGYAFICIFVLLTSISAFWPPEFFNSNLAGFDQLNQWIPQIMLIFIPAITMSIWADERRQGTDELLLTLPATDFDIVMGKYLAAVSIFTASLLFSQICNYFCLVWLAEGDLDTGLLFATYFGYWVMGLSMLAMGMVASFLTSNLTIGFILGAAINVPLVGARFAEVIIPRAAAARNVSFWSLGRQVEDFGRGVISLPGIAYFLLVAFVGLYLSMVLIGRRHWSGGRDGQSLWMHYIARIVAVFLVVVAANIVLLNWGRHARKDVTEAQVNSLSSDTRRIIESLETKYPIRIDAYVGASIPEEYVRTRSSLIAMLREFESLSRGKIKVNIFDNLEPFSDEAEQAAKRYNIRPRPIAVRDKGVHKNEQVLLGAGIRCGLERVVVPFFDVGIPVEYELVRSINTVCKGTRKKIGVVRTDAQVMGGVEMNGMQPQSIEKEKIIEELEKQYEVVSVEPSKPIEFKKNGKLIYSALLVPQPSSLGMQELANVIDVVRKGQPTAIFEDPLPQMIRAPGTGQERRQQSFMGAPAAPKGRITDLWKLLGIRVEGERSRQNPNLFDAQIIWQSFNPYKKVQSAALSDEFVFIRPDAPYADDPFNPNDQVTSGLDEVLFPFPGAISPDPDNTEVKFTSLVETSKRSGRISFNDWLESRTDALQLQERQGPFTGKYTIAARLQGKDANGKPTNDAKSKKSDEKNKDSSKSSADDAETSDTGPINVIYIADIDVMSSVFVQLRDRPEDDFRFRFENVPFVLNVIDSLANENDYIEIRKRKPHYSTLKTIERFVDEARNGELQERDKFKKERDNAIAAAKAERDEEIRKLKDKVDEMNEKVRRGDQIDPAEVQAMGVQFRLREETANQKLTTIEERLKREHDDKIQKIQREKDLQIENFKREFKLRAVLFPPIFPLLIALIVFVSRQLREREGISKARLV